MTWSQNYTPVWHSIALGMLMGVSVMVQAYVFPWMIVVPPAVAPCPAQLTKTDGFFHRAKLKNIHA